MVGSREDCSSALCTHLPGGHLTNEAMCHTKLQCLQHGHTAPRHASCSVLSGVSHARGCALAHPHLHAAGLLCCVAEHALDAAVTLHQEGALAQAPAAAVIAVAAAAAAAAAAAVAKVSAAAAVAAAADAAGVPVGCAAASAAARRILVTLSLEAAPLALHTPVADAAKTWARCLLGRTRTLHQAGAAGRLRRVRLACLECRLQLACAHTRCPQTGGAESAVRAQCAAPPHSRPLSS